MSYDALDASSYEPHITGIDAQRAHRKTRLALAYRVFGAMRWGHLGDGHISARDPELLDHFWVGGFGVPFNAMTVHDLVLVDPHGAIVSGSGAINPAAYHIHWPVHEARPDVVCAAHTHTPYGTPFAALGTLLRPITQESCSFYEDHQIFCDDEVDIASTDGGKRIGAALGGAKAIILRNHGLLTVGQTVDEAIGWFVSMERSAEAHIKAPDATAIGHDAALRARESVGRAQLGWIMFQFLLRTYVPDPSVVG